MTEDSTAPPVPDSGPPPSTPPRISRPGGPAAVRPPTGKKAAPPPGPPSNVKKYLVIGIIVSTVVLLGLIGWRLYVRLSGKPVVVRNVKKEWEAAFSKSDQAWRDVFKMQAKVWVEGKELSPEDLEKIKAALKEYQKTSEIFHELNALVLKKGQGPSQDLQDIGEKLIILKTWIWDANGVLDPANKPPKYGGLYIPMYSAEKRRETAVNRLKEFREKAAEITARKDVAEIEAAIKDVRAMIDTFGAIRDELLQLDEELLKGLTLPDLKVEQLRELDELRGYQNKAGMGIKEAREVRSMFPALEDLKPKEEPKEEPKKEPPKEEPPKEEPPKKEPPKEEPPKEEPPK